MCYPMNLFSLNWLKPPMEVTCIIWVALQSTKAMTETMGIFSVFQNPLYGRWNVHQVFFSKFTVLSGAPQVVRLDSLEVIVQARLLQFWMDRMECDSFSCYFNKVISL